MGPSNGIDSRGWRLKPSSVLSTCVSWLSGPRGCGGVGQRQVDAQAGVVLPSSTVKRSLGNGLVAAGVGKVKQRVNGRQQRSILQRFEVHLARRRVSSTSCPAIRNPPEGSAIQGQRGTT